MSDKLVIGDLIDGSAIVYKKERLGLVNGLMFDDGSVRWFPQYSLGWFHCGLSVFQDKVSHYFGIMNRWGKILLPARHAAITDFSENRAFVCDCTRLINTECETVKEWDDHFVADEFHEGLAILSRINEESAGMEKLDGFVNTDGEWIIPQIYRNVIDVPSIHYSDDICSDGMIRVRLEGKCGYINKRNELVIPPMFDWGCRFTSGLAAVKLDSKYGFINKQSEVVLPFTYDDAQPFSEGLAAVVKNGKWGCIDTSGQIVLPFLFDDLSPFIKGHAPAQVGNVWGIIDVTGSFIIKPQFDLISHFREGIAAIVYRNRTGVIDRQSNMLLNDTIMMNEYGNLS